MDRLRTSGPKRVDSSTVKEWCLFTDAHMTTMLALEA